MLFEMRNAPQLFGHKMLPLVPWMVPLFVSLSCFGSINGILFTSGRLFEAGAQNGHLPGVLALRHVHQHTPAPALVITVSPPALAALKAALGLALGPHPSSGARVAGVPREVPSLPPPGAQALTLFGLPSHRPCWRAPWSWPPTCTPSSST